MRYDTSTPQSLREITEEDVEINYKLEDVDECSEMLCLDKAQLCTQELHYIWLQV